MKIDQWQERLDGLVFAIEMVVSYSSYSASEVKAMPVWDFMRLMYVCEQRVEAKKKEADKLKSKR